MSIVPRLCNVCVCVLCVVCCVLCAVCCVLCVLCAVCCVLCLQVPDAYRMSPEGSRKKQKKKKHKHGRHDYSKNLEEASLNSGITV